MMKKTVLNWSDLDSDLLSEIIDRISCLRDFIIFGAVCKSWRSVASPEKFNKSTKVPWLLLDQKEDDNCHHFTTMILYHLSGAVSPRLAFWKNGDRNWTDIDLIFPSDLIEMTYQNGRYYAAHLNDGPNGYVIHEIDIQNSAFVSTRTKSFSNLSMDTFNPYPFWIVGSSRGLFMVTSELRFNLEIRGGSHPIGLLDIDSYILQFIVEEVDFERGESKEVKDFGDEALFVGLESSFFADVSKESKLKSNHIYFAEKFQELWSYTRRGAGVYSMMDRSYKRLFTEADYGYGSSQWFEPRL
ncbi:uncharacterized protein LOC126662163 isoform X2 [Mercurialis annua]|uniref:uncharacterized protein LOC126662163 isoform X2 n=1 Tax=Mercurialis annua TaxID=3986 RepID=UPI00216048DB|nr:uncharacterized protein LOC126662163 isoform X2 [Mercurialis annua]